MQIYLKNMHKYTLLMNLLFGTVCCTIEVYLNMQGVIHEICHRTNVSIHETKRPKSN